MPPKIRNNYYCTALQHNMVPYPNKSQSLRNCLFDSTDCSGEAKNRAFFYGSRAQNRVLRMNCHSRLWILSCYDDDDDVVVFQEYEMNRRRALLLLLLVVVLLLSSDCASIMRPA